MVFAGPVGVGKGTTAAALAKLFLCEKPKESTPCDACDGCRMLNAGNHPDYHIVTRELIRYHDKTGKSKGIDLSINVLRPELIEPANRKAVMGRGKVFVIEEAHTMNAQAQNALLKTLEEPAGRTVITLLTEQPDLLLPTIRSRCQTIRFFSLPSDVVAAELKRRSITPQDASDAALFAGGSLGVALKWIEDGVLGSAREMANTIEGIIAGRMPDDLPGWFKKAAEAYAERQLARDELASKDQANREGLSVYLRIAAEHARRKLADTTDDDELERICGMIDALARAEEYLDANVNVALVFQQLTVTLERSFAAAR